MVKATYNLMVIASNENSNVINWASLIKYLLFKLGFAEVWYEQNVGNLNVFKSLCKQRLFDQYSQ